MLMRSLRPKLKRGWGNEIRWLSGHRDLQPSTRGNTTLGEKMRCFEYPNLFTLFGFHVVVAFIAGLFWAVLASVV